MIVKPVGIENVVNWKDNGIFADTQKPVTDDNYTLAGDVNQDNLYVGYMKEHGLKGKLSLPVLSSLGAITGRQTIGDCEVYKHVNGTTIIKGAVINPNLPDSRISLGFSADENGLQYYNNPNDPMPIKTINMAGLQKWEETDDYIIYVDKDAVMTTVQNYVTGTYDLFLERKANVDGAMELLRENGIEWTAEDDSKLLQDINLAQLERVANTPTTMDEPTEIQTFEARTVPTTYECCFRTDKKTGEIYIGEGYENYGLLRKSVLNNLAFGANLSHVTDTIDGITIDIPSGTFLESNAGTQGFLYRRQLSGFAVESDYFTVGFEFKITEGKTSVYNHAFGTKRLDNPDTVLATSTFNNFGISIFPDNIKPGESTTERIVVKILKHNATKTSTPKPFVKSVMPSGKLSFVTNADFTKHSFVIKGSEKSSKTILPISLDASTHNYSRCELFQGVGKSDILISENYFGIINGSGRKLVSEIPTKGIVCLSVSTSAKPTSFKQLLIYKGNLTESELKAENEKVINVGAYYQQENSVPLIYGIDSMKSMRVYSPALTDIEIAEEVNKNIYIPENRDGVPNYLGEVK